VTLVWWVTLVCSVRLTKPGATGFRQLTKLNHGPRGLKWGEAVTPRRAHTRGRYRDCAADEYGMGGGELKVPSRFWT
jgi:hypothetical protein